MAMFCLSLGVVYSQLFNSEIDDYLPFLSTGFVVWGLVSGILGEFPNVFVDNASFIKDIRINPFSIIFRLMTRHIIIFAHNLLIVVGIYLYFQINPGKEILYFLPGVFLVVLNLLAMGIFLSVLGARFRDVAPTVQALIQVIFFITPITWFPKLLPKTSWVVEANPFVYFLDLTRSPLLGSAPQDSSWFVAGLTLIAFSGLAAYTYQKKNTKIPFWV
jgi:ABC-type polysaccharide/polyol phosphate export permease